MARTGGVPGRGWWPGQRWWARVPVVAAGLLLTERALVAAVGRRSRSCRRCGASAMGGRPGSSAARRAGAPGRGADRIRAGDGRIRTRAAKRSRAFRLALLVFAGMEDEGAKALNAYTGRIRFSVSQASKP